MTVPLGVLKAGAIAFAPALPEKEAALRRLEMGDAARVSLGFGGGAWAASDRFSSGGFLLRGEPPFPVWWVSRAAPFPVITGWAGGRYARALGDLDDAERIRVAVHALASALEADAGRLRQDLRVGFSHNWHTDPFARGA
jgi:monoamine oxidase